jgi:hypothetical protein
MTTSIIATALIAVGVGIALGALIRDQRIERLRLRLDNATNDANNWQAAAHLHDTAAEAWRARSDRFERQARDNELAINLFAFELDRQRDALAAPAALAMVAGSGEGAEVFEWVNR